MKPLVEIQKGMAVQRDHIGVVSSSEDGTSCRVYVHGESFAVSQRYDVLMNHIHAPEGDVMDAARQLLYALDMAVPHLQALLKLGRDSGQPYGGPDFAEQVEDLRIAVRQAE